MLRRTVQIGAVACVVALMVGGPSAAQPGGAGGGPRDGGRGMMFDPNQIRQMMMGGMFDPTQMRQRMMERMRDRLGVKDDAEWKVIEPRLRKLMDLNQQALMGRAQGLFGMVGALGMFGGGHGGPGDGNDGGQTPPMRRSGPNGGMTALEKAMAQLRTTLANQSAAPDDVNKALTAVREAGLRMQQDRAMAQADLKKILTLRQEAVLVEMGQLD